MQRQLLEQAAVCTKSSALLSLRENRGLIAKDLCSLTDPFVRGRPPGNTGPVVRLVRGATGPEISRLWESVLTSELHSGIVNDQSDDAKSPQSRRAAFLKLGAFLLIVVFAFLVASRIGLFHLTNREVLAAAIERVRTVRYLALLFIVAYALAVTFGLPATAFTMAGGVIFGFGRGLLFNWLGAMIGAVLAYFFAGAFCGDACRVVLGRRADTLQHLAETHGFWGTFRLRLIPVIPFGLLNYAAAMAGVRRRDYLLATALGILPGSAVYTYFAGSLVQGVEGAGRRALINFSVAAALLILLSFLPKIVHWIEGRRRPADTR